MVVCIDERSQCQDLESGRPILLMHSEIAERRTLDCARHGGAGVERTCLFTALNVSTGQVTDACSLMHRHEEVLGFLKKVSAAYPGRLAALGVR